MCCLGKVNLKGKYNIIKEMRVNNFKVSWGSDDSGRVEIGERGFVCGEVRVIDREMFEGDEDEVIKWLLEGGWSEVNEFDNKINEGNLEVVMMDNGDWEYDRVGIGVEDGKCVVVDIEEGCDEDGNYLGWKVNFNSVEEVIDSGLKNGWCVENNNGYDKRDRYRYSMDEDDLNKFENWLKVNKG